MCGSPIVTRWLRLFSVLSIVVDEFVRIAFVMADFFFGKKKSKTLKSAKAQLNLTTHNLWILPNI